MKNLNEYPTPETDGIASTAWEGVSDDYSAYAKMLLHSRSLERRLAACREALELVKEMHEHEATGDPDRQPTDEGRERHAEMIRENLAATAKP